MTSSIKFKLVIEQDGEDVLDTFLSYEEISNFISNADDDVANTKLYEFAALHSSSQVRENVASKNSLNETTVQVLQADPSISVLRNLVLSKKFRECASSQLLERYISMDTELARSIASDIESFGGTATVQLAKIISEHTDPAVLACLARNYQTPKNVLKSLADSCDSLVAREARRQLQS